MLTFLALAAKKRFVVQRYTDRATGYLGKNGDGKMAVTRLVLRPDARFVGEKQPSPQEIAELHERAHGHCFITNSVKAAVTVEQVGQPTGAA
jgi:organic hydroperoxide reductase OsmC/OhrA